MKTVLTLIPLTFLLGACVTGAEYDQEKAYARCEKMPVVTYRDKCYAEAIADAQHERNEIAKDIQRQNDEAEQRELNRVIAGAEQD